MRKRTAKAAKVAIRSEALERRILMLRGLRVILDSDLAMLYEVETRALNQAVRRNRERFPDDFMFQLNEAETSHLKSQLVISNTSRGQHSKYLPHAFTEHGVAMLSSVLNSKRAVQMNIHIMRTFVKLREVSQKDDYIVARIEKIEEQQLLQQSTMEYILGEIRSLRVPAEPAKRRIGFQPQSVSPHARSKPATA